jgi:hypothetical protein
MARGAHTCLRRRSPCLPTHRHPGTRAGSLSRSTSLQQLAPCRFRQAVGMRAGEQPSGTLRRAGLWPRAAIRQCPLQRCQQAFPLAGEIGGNIHPSVKPFEPRRDVEVAGLGCGEVEGGVPRAAVRTRPLQDVQASTTSGSPARALVPRAAVRAQPLEQLETKAAPSTKPRRERRQWSSGCWAIDGGGGWRPRRLPRGDLRLGLSQRLSRPCEHEPHAVHGRLTRSLTAELPVRHRVVSPAEGGAI